jgi:hypothetical protein
MSKELTTIYFRWLNQVAEDPMLPGSAFKLAFIYQQHVSSDHMKAFAGQTRLAEFVGVTERSIRSLTKLLKDRGHLDVETNHGPNQTNVCRLILNRKSASSLSLEIQMAFLKPVGPNEEAGFLINEEAERTKIGKIEFEKRKPASDKLLLNHSCNQDSAKFWEGKVKADGPVADQYRRWWAATGQAEPAYSRKSGYYLKPLPPLPAEYAA